MAFSEPEGTANFAAPPPAEGVRTTARPDGDWWVINGRKAWASHLAGWDGNGPDVMTIVSRTPGGVSLIVAEREQLAGHIEVEEHYDLVGLRGCMTSRIRLHDVRVPRSNLLGSEGQGVKLTHDSLWASGAAIGIFAVAAMRQAFEVAYRYAMTEKRGGAVPLLDHQSVADVLADAKSRIEAVRLLAWRALDAVIAQDDAGPELALHSKIFGSEMGVDVINRLMNVVGVQAYDSSFLLMAYLSEALAYPIIEGQQYRHPSPSAPGPVPHTGIQPAQRLRDGLMPSARTARPGPSIGRGNADGRYAPGARRTASSLCESMTWRCGDSAGATRIYR